MTAGKILGKGISFPPRVNPDGRVAWSEGEDNVAESIRVILMTDLRERLMLPEFGGGLHRFLFEPNTVTTRQLIRDRITRALGTWEPRVQLDSVTVEEDPDDRQAAIAEITYRLIATGQRDSMALSVRLTA